MNKDKMLKIVQKYEPNVHWELYNGQPAIYDKNLCTRVTLYNRWMGPSLARCMAPQDIADFWAAFAEEPSLKEQLLEIEGIQEDRDGDLFFRRLDGSSAFVYWQDENRINMSYVDMPMGFLEWLLKKKKGQI